MTWPNNNQPASSGACGSTATNPSDRKYFRWERMNESDRRELDCLNGYCYTEQFLSYKANNEIVIDLYFGPATYFCAVVRSTTPPRSIITSSPVFNTWSRVLYWADEYFKTYKPKVPAETITVPVVHEDGNATYTTNETLVAKAWAPVTQKEREDLGITTSGTWGVVYRGYYKAKTHDLDLCSTLHSNSADRWFRILLRERANPSVKSYSSILLTETMLKTWITTFSGDGQDHPIPPGLDEAIAANLPKPEKTPEPAPVVNEEPSKKESRATGRWEELAGQESADFGNTEESRIWVEVCRNYFVSKDYVLDLAVDSTSDKYRAVVRPKHDVSKVVKLSEYLLGIGGAWSHSKSLLDDVQRNHIKQNRGPLHVWSALTEEEKTTGKWSEVWREWRISDDFVFDLLYVFGFFGVVARSREDLSILDVSPEFTTSEHGPASGHFAWSERYIKGHSKPTEKKEEPKPVEPPKEEPSKKPRVSRQWVPLDPEELTAATNAGYGPWEDVYRDHNSSNDYTVDLVYRAKTDSPDSPASNFMAVVRPKADLSKIVRLSAPFPPLITWDACNKLVAEVQKEHDEFLGKASTAPEPTKLPETSPPEFNPVKVAHFNKEAGTVTTGKVTGYSNGEMTIEWQDMIFPVVVGDTKYYQFVAPDEASISEIERLERAKAADVKYWGEKIRDAMSRMPKVNPFQQCLDANPHLNINV